MHDDRWEAETEKVPIGEEDKTLSAKEKVFILVRV